MRHAPAPENVTNLCNYCTFRLAGIEEDQDLLAACVFDVIEAVDISKDEVVENAMKCKFIFNMLKSKRT